MPISSPQLRCDDSKATAFGGLAAFSALAVKSRILLRKAAATLREAGVEEPQRQAALLLSAVLGTSPTWLQAAGYDVSVDEQCRFENLVAGRAARRPLQYLLSEAQFCGRSFVVDDAVLIPRPETAVLVEASLSRLRGRPGRVLEIGTGSGIIAVTVAAELPAHRLEGTEISPAALAVARANARVYGVAGRVQFRLGDLFAGIKPAGQYDAIISNPPYVPSSELAGLAPEVRCEPRVALDGGPDGMSVLRRIIEQAPAYLRDGGWLLLECGQGQAQQLSNLVSAARAWDGCEIFKDDRGIERVIVAQRFDGSLAHGQQ